MKCSRCDQKAIYYNNNEYFCKDHFIQYYENKVLETIEKYKLIKSGDKIGVGVSGGKDSNALMFFLNKYKDYFNIEVFGIHIDEGIKRYRTKNTEFLLKIAKKYGWKIKIYKFKDYFGYELDEIVKNIKEIKPCTVCGVFRRWLMWKASTDLNLTKIATAHNLNDEIQTIFMNIFENNIKDFIKSGPKVGIIEEGFIERIKPFFFIKEKENLIYALIHNLVPPWGECPYIIGQIRDEIRKNLYSIEKYFPGFQEKVLENIIKKIFDIKKNYKKDYKINKCKLCGYPTSREICRACEIKNILRARGDLNPRPTA